MEISKAYQGKIFGDYVEDMFSHAQLKIPFLQWENGEPCIIKKYDDYEDQDRLRWYLKIFDEKYPKYPKGYINQDGKLMEYEPYSFKDVDSRTITHHMEYYRLVLSNNGLWFKSDEDEWQRIINATNY